jgi:hypothetical protein
MRAHTLSIAIGAYSNGDWSVAVVQKTLSNGVVVNEDLFYGPSYVREPDLERAVLRAVRKLQEQARQDQAAQPSR